jgi:hypothetical protein
LGHAVKKQKLNIKNQNYGIRPFDKLRAGSSADGQVHGSGFAAQQV